MLVAAVAAMLVGAAPAASQGRDFYGVGAQGSLGQRDFELMQDARVGSLRVLVNWQGLRRSDGGYDSALWTSWSAAPR